MAVSNQASSSFKIKNVPRHLVKEEVKMKNLLRLLLKTQHQRNRFQQTQKEQGMTLIELLIGMVMAFLIITPMLAFVVDMLNTDRREQVKANTEQDIQAAVDFIAQDLSQAIYIYDSVGINALVTGRFIPTATTQTPILVFWKRQQLKNSLPITAGDKPKDCVEGKLQDAGACNDTYVLSLVAYYQVKDTTSTWCQPSGTDCPARIVRYRIQDGLRDPTKSTEPNPSQRYFTDADLGDRKNTLRRSDAFNVGDTTNAGFDISKPLETVTRAGVSWEPEEVLVNYIHHNTVNLPTPDAEECMNALGRPTTLVGATPQKIPEGTLKITDSTSPTPTNSFYACVDTARNLARVTIRGNSLRRIQNNADYNPNNSAYFPTATVQVQGLGARGN
jgi:type II secretory pathway pseudopilin PulG